MTSVIRGQLVRVEINGDPPYLGIAGVDTQVLPLAQVIDQSLAHIANNPNTVVAWRFTDEFLLSGFAEEQVMIKLAGQHVMGDLFAHFDNKLNGLTLRPHNTEIINVDVALEDCVVSTVDLLDEWRKHTNEWITLHIKTPYNKYNPRREADD